MKQVRKCRVLRIRNGITITELAEAAGISVQRMSFLELNTEYRSEKAEQRIRQAFEAVLHRRARLFDALWEDLRRHDDTLLEVVEDVTAIREE